MTIPLPGPTQADGSSGDKLQIYYYSPQPWLIDIFSAGRGQMAGAIVSLTFSKYGGLTSFEVKMPRDFDSPLSVNGYFVFYYGNYLNNVTDRQIVRVPIATGIIKQLPPRGTTSDEITISGVGIASRFSEIKVTRQFTNKTIAEIITTLETNYFTSAGVTYNAAKVTVPAITITALNWDDTNLSTCIMDLISICNNDFQTEEYCYGVDPYGEFYFLPMAKTTVQNQFFEGFHFQAPEVSVDRDRIVNQIVAFRATLADPTVIEYVDTYSDTSSINEYQLFEKKIVIPSHISTAGIADYVNGILSNYKDPKTIITVNNLLLSINNLAYYGAGLPGFILTSNYYGIATKKKNQYFLIDEFNDLSAWTSTIDPGDRFLSNAGMSGRQCTIIQNAGYIEKLFDSVYSPNVLRLYANGRSISIQIELLDFDLSLTGESDEIVDNAGNGIIIDTGLQVSTQALSSSPVSTGVYTYTFWTSVDDPLPAWSEIKIDLSNVRRIGGIRITSNWSIPDSAVLLDRLEIEARQYAAELLPLEQANYQISNDQFLCTSATFGGVPTELTGEINDISKDATTFEDVTAKQ